MSTGQTTGLLYRNLEAVFPEICFSSWTGSSGLLINGLYMPCCWSVTEMLPMRLDFAYTPVSTSSVPRCQRSSSFTPPQCYRRAQTQHLQPWPAEWCLLCEQVVPKETPPIPRLFIQELPGLSQFEELQLPDLPNCVSEHGFSSLILPKEGGISLQLVYMDSALIFSLQALSSQSASMDKEGKKVVFTNFIYPFLSRNDSSGN